MADPTTTERDHLPDPRIAALRDRHAHALSRLMEERADLRGVHALADMVSDSLRWSA